MLFARESGVLVHPSSLPGAYGAGDIGIGENAAGEVGAVRRLLDVLQEMRQALWQVLPLTPPGTAASPYQGRSSFAGDTLLLSLDALLKQGLLEPQEVESARYTGPMGSGRIDFQWLESTRPALLRRAAVRFLSAVTGSSLGSIPPVTPGSIPPSAYGGPALGPHMREQFEQFCEAQDYWLHDYARFQAIKNARAGDDWLSWPRDIRLRQPEALETVDFELGSSIKVEKALQFLFEQQWQAVRQEARQRNIRIVGDLPIFVALDSADVWASQHLFQLDEQGQPTVVAGVPPDYFSKTGQRWGNPLFDWEAHAMEGYQWWTRRLRRTLEMTDITRVDHFRGFAACWEIPADEPTAIHGRWAPTPGKELFDVLKSRLGSDLPIIAEDLGILTDDVVELRDGLGLPTMRILQFSFNGEEKLLPHRYPENCVCYTGTHDNDTVVGWYAGEPDDSSVLSPEELEVERDRVRRYYATDGTNIHYTAIRGVMSTQACAALFPIQDAMGLGSSARVNTPGTMGPHNWSWRFDWSQLTQEAIETIAAITRETDRNRHLPG